MLLNFLAIVAAIDTRRVHAVITSPFLERHKCAEHHLDHHKVQLSLPFQHNLDYLFAGKADSAFLQDWLHGQNQCNSRMLLFVLSGMFLFFNIAEKLLIEAAKEEIHAF